MNQENTENIFQPEVIQETLLNNETITILITTLLTSVFTIWFFQLLKQIGVKNSFLSISIILIIIVIIYIYVLNRIKRDEEILN